MTNRISSPQIIANMTALQMASHSHICAHRASSSMSIEYAKLIREVQSPLTFIYAQIGKKRKKILYTTIIQIDKICISIRVGIYYTHEAIPASRHCRPRLCVKWDAAKSE